MTHEFRPYRPERRPKPHAPEARVVFRGNGAAPPIVAMDEGYVSRSTGAKMDNCLRVEKPHHVTGEPHFARAAEAILRVRPDASPALLQEIGEGELSRDAYKLVGYVLGDRKIGLTVAETTSLKAVRENYRDTHQGR